MIVFGEAQLRRILGKYAAYYDESRIHLRAVVSGLAAYRRCRTDRAPTRPCGTVRPVRCDINITVVANFWWVAGSATFNQKQKALKLYKKV